MRLSLSADEISTADFKHAQLRFQRRVGLLRLGLLEQDRALASVDLVAQIEIGLRAQRAIGAEQAPAPPALTPSRAGMRLC